MADSPCFPDLVEQARKWPASLRARRAGGHWQLRAPPKTYTAAFRVSAQRIIRKLALPNGPRSTRPVDALLYRLEGNGHNVRVRQVEKHGVSSADRYTVALISPLRDALIEYLRQGCPEPRHAPLASLQSPAANRRSRGGSGGKVWETNAQAMGQAKAAEGNRQRQTRHRVITVLQRLGISCDEWPDFVRTYHADPQQRTEYSHCQLPAPFQPPEFNRLSQSPEEWTKAADQAWETHRNRFLQSCQHWVESEVDEEIQAAKHTRDPGGHLINRGNNTAVGRRYEWAAKYLARMPLKEIAARDGADPSTVGRIAREILRQADWLEPAKTNRRV